MLCASRMKTLLFLLVALPCVAKPVDAARLSKLLGFTGQMRARVETPATTLTFRLLGTLRGAQPLVALAAASRVVTATIGDVISGVEIVTIERLEITVRRDGRLERLRFGSTLDPSPAAAPTTLTRALVNQHLADPSSLMQQVRLVPSFRDGRWSGFKTLSVQPGSLIEKLGLRRGDVIKAVNGLPLDQPERLMTLLQHLQSGRRFEVELERDGQRVTQTLTLDE